MKKKGRKLKKHSGYSPDYKQLLDEVFVISGIIKVKVSVISRSRRLRLITGQERAPSCSKRLGIVVIRNAP